MCDQVGWEEVVDILRGKTPRTDVIVIFFKFIDICLFLLYGLVYCGCVFMFNVKI